MSTATLTHQDPATTPENDPWTMEVGSGGGGGDYVLCPPGNYPATIVGIFDVGHQLIRTKDKGEQEIRKLALVYELAKARPDGKPFVLAETYTWSMRDTSNLYALVCGLMGRKLREGEKFSPRWLLNGPCMVNVTNSQSGEKTYHNIAGVSQFPDGFPPPKPTYTATIWTVQTGEAFPSGLDWLPYVYGKPIKAMAEASSEFRKAYANPPGPGQGPGDSVPY